MKHLEGNAGRLGVLNERVRHGGERDAHAAGGRTSNAGQRGDGDDFVDQRVGNGLQGVGDDEEAGQGGDDRTETIFRSGVHGSQLGAADGRPRAIGELPHHRLPGEGENGENADEQRPFHGPDRGDLDRLLAACAYRGPTTETPGYRDTGSALAAALRT